MITQLRNELAEILGNIAHVHIVPHNVDRPNPPEIAIMPGSPWVEHGEVASYGRPYDLRFQLVVTVPRGEQGRVLALLEGVAADVLALLGSGVGGWRVESVSQPYIIAGDTYQLPAVTINVRIPL